MHYTKDEKDIIKNKISAIIPTIQANTDLLTNLILSLDKDSCVFEIIVINNSTEPLPKIHSSKIKILDFGENLYVNKSWNIGVEESRAEFYALFNDDLILPENFCSKILPLLSKDNGLYGFNKEFVQEIDHPEPYNETFELYIEPADRRRLGYGIIMMGHRENYTPIPDNLKIFCGDDYLFFMNEKNGKTNYKISGCPIKHCHQLSSNKPEFFKIKQQDCFNYKKINKKYKIPKPYLPNHTKFIRKLFQMYNVYEGEQKYKCINILGFTITLKKNRGNHAI